MIDYHAFPGLVDTTFPTPERIILSVCKRFNISYDKMQARTRRREVVECRQIAMYLIRHSIGNVELKTIGDLFGGQHHTTVIHSLRTVQNRMETEPEYAQIVYDLAPTTFRKPYTPIKIIHTH